MTVISIGISITDIGLLALTKSPRIDIGIATDFTESKIIVMQTIGYIAVAHHIIQSTPKTIGRKAVIEIVHRDAVHISAEQIIVVTADMKTGRTEIIRSSREERIATGSECRADAGLSSVALIV